MAIERDEFQHAVTLIREDIKQVHDRLDLLNGRTRANETNIVRLQERIKPRKSQKAMALGSLGGIVALVAEVVKYFVK